MKKQKQTAAAAALAADETAYLDALWSKFAGSFDRYAADLPCTRMLNNIDKACMLDCSNILLYSATGVPVDLVWTSMIQRIFNFKINTTEKIYDKEVIYYESQYHFHVDMSLPYQTTSMTKLTGFIKDIIIHRCICPTHRHVIVITSIDTLIRTDSDASRALRVLLEKYSANVWFICTTTAISSIEKPLQSRFIAVRVPALTNDQINNILVDLWMPQLMNIDTHACSRNVAFCIYLSYLLHTNREVDDIRYSFIRETMANCETMANRETMANCETMASPQQVVTMDAVRKLAARLHAYDASLLDITNDLTIIYPERAGEIVTVAAAIDHKHAHTGGIRKSLYIEYLLASVAKLVQDISSVEIEYDDA